MATRAAVTPRQAEVIELVARGLTTKEIAAALGVSDRAVTAQLSRLMTKFSAPNRAGLIAAIMSKSGIGVPTAELARVYEDAPFVVAVSTGPQHLITFVNRVAAKFMGSPPEVLIGRSIHGSYPDLDPRLVEGLDSVYRTGIPWSVEQVQIVWTHTDGTRRSEKLNLIYHPLKDAAGAVIGLLHIGVEA